MLTDPVPDTKKEKPTSPWLLIPVGMILIVLGGIACSVMFAIAASLDGTDCDLPDAAADGLPADPVSGRRHRPLPGPLMPFQKGSFQASPKPKKTGRPKRRPVVVQNLSFMDSVAAGTNVLFAAECGKAGKKHPNDTVRCEF